MHQRPRPARRRAGDPQRDRPERRRQDDAVQPDHRRVRARRRRDRVRGREPARPRAARDRQARDRAHVPDAPPLPEHDRQGERDGGRLLALEGRHLPLDPAHSRDAARGARDLGARRGPARLLRRAPDGLPVEPARLQPLLREPAPAGDRAGDSDTTPDAAPRRAGGGDEPGGDARDHRADRAAARGGGVHDPRDRARHARRRGHLRPGDRARPRLEDRRGDFEAVATNERVVEAYLGLKSTATRAPVSGNGDAAPLLRLAAVDTYYGPIHILQGIELHVRAGELVCLLGGNASGKSTTLKTILGIVQPRNGTVEFAGEDVTTRATNYRIRKGMAIVPENRRLFAPMTVLENLQMGAYLRSGGEPADFERVYELFPRLYERRDQLAGTLSGGEQQMAAMGRALMSRPSLLLMDEPSMGLAPLLVEKSFEIIKQVNDEGVAVLVVEQNANVSLSIADRGYVLSTGRVVLEGRPAT